MISNNAVVAIGQFLDKCQNGFAWFWHHFQTIVQINHIYIDEALNDYDVIWAAGGHPHAVFPTSFIELKRVTSAAAIAVE